MSSKLSSLCLVGLSAGKVLAEKIAQHLKINLCNVSLQRFSDGEIFVRSEETIRNKDVVIVQSTSRPTNDNLMELLIAIDAFKRASARSITIICPYFGYARQDRKASGREPITARLVADLLEKAGANRIAIVDIHSEQTQGFFSIPMDNLTALTTIMRNIEHDFKNFNNFTIISPDYGSVKRARKISHQYQIPLVILDKRRPLPNVAEITNVLGDVEGKDCLIFDDIVDTGGTLLAACQVLKQKKVKRIVIAATHAILSGHAVESISKNILNGVIDKIYFSNTIQDVYNVEIPKMKIVDMSSFLAKIVKVYAGLDNYQSISAIYHDID